LSSQETCREALPDQENQVGWIWDRLVVIRQRAGYVDQMHHGSILVAKNSQQNTIGHSFRHE